MEEMLQWEKPAILPGELVPCKIPLVVAHSAAGWWVLEQDVGVALCGVLNL
jgi:hypothetical protein